MKGMGAALSSLLYGYPVCQCCHFVAGHDREQLHAAIARRLEPALGEGIVQ